jgi:hypothetical protein
MTKKTRGKIRNSHPDFFATDLHGLSRIFIWGYLFFCIIVNLLNSSVLIRVSPRSSVAKIIISKMETVYKK